MAGWAKDQASEKGFGWLFEVEPDDDEELFNPNVPLLEELDLSPEDILNKVRRKRVYCVCTACVLRVCMCVYA